MVLVDSSVWVDHFHRPEPQLIARLEAGEVLTHSMVIAELACGHLASRRTTLGLLHALPKAEEASPAEVLALVENDRLWGAGLGAVDVHLLASVRLSDAAIWTRDKALARAAGRRR